GLFMQGRLDLDSGPSLLAGLRYDRLRFSATDRFISADNPDDSGERVMDALSPSVGLLINAGTDLEVFASIAGSFETPTTTEIVNRPSGAGGFNPDLEPQKGFTIESGIRGGVGDQGTFELALFQTKLTGELVPFEVPSNPGLTYYQNAGRSLYRGWEASLDTRLGENASTRIAYTRVNGSFKEFITDDADYSGNKIPGLAPHRVDGLFQVDLDEFYLALRGLFQADIPVDNGGQFSSESFFVADVRLGVENLVLGSLKASPFVAVQNVLDAWYNSSVIVNAFGKRFYEPGPGRTFLLGLGLTWGN
ncbi:MAG: TonB-dependent receptor, partial [bacterium]